MKSQCASARFRIFAGLLIMILCVACGAFAQSNTGTKAAGNGKRFLGRGCGRSRCHGPQHGNQHNHAHLRLTVTTARIASPDLQVGSYEIRAEHRRLQSRGSFRPDADGVAGRSRQLHARSRRDATDRIGYR